MTHSGHGGMAQGGVTLGDMDISVVWALVAILLVVGVAYRVDRHQAAKRRQKKQDDAMEEQNALLRKIAEQGQKPDQRHDSGV